MTITVKTMKSPCESSHEDSVGVEALRLMGLGLLQGDYVGGFAFVGVEHLGVNLRVLDIAVR